MGFLIDKLKELDRELDKFPVLKKINDSIEGLIDSAINAKNPITYVLDSLSSNVKRSDNYLKFLTEKYDYSSFFSQYESLLNALSGSVISRDFASEFSSIKNDYEKELRLLKEDIGQEKKWKLKGDADSFLKNYIDLSKLANKYNKMLNEKGLEQLKLLRQAYLKKNSSMLDLFHEKMKIPSEYTYLIKLDQAKKLNQLKLIKSYSPLKSLDNVLSIIPLSDENEKILKSFC